MNLLTLQLPWPPSLNHYKKIGRTVRTKSGKLLQFRTNSDQTKQYYFDVWALCKKELGNKKPLECELEIWIYVYPPNNRSFDLDNRCKVLLDSLIHAKVIKDDSQIMKLHMEKMSKIENGQVIVEIKELLCPRKNTV